MTKEMRDNIEVRHRQGGWNWLRICTATDLGIETFIYAVVEFATSVAQFYLLLALILGMLKLMVIPSESFPLQSLILGRKLGLSP
jgi:hypothetical protein